MTNIQWATAQKRPWPQVLKHKLLTLCYIRIPHIKDTAVARHPAGCTSPTLASLLPHRRTPASSLQNLAKFLPLPCPSLIARPCDHRAAHKVIPEKMPVTMTHVQRLRPVQTASYSHSRQAHYCVYILRLLLQCPKHQPDDQWRGEVSSLVPICLSGVHVWSTNLSATAVGHWPKCPAPPSARALPQMLLPYEEF